MSVEGAVPAQAIVARSRSRIVGRTHESHLSVPSTNDLAWERVGAAEEPDRIDGHAVFAAHQSAGRGRLGRRWVASPGSSLLASFVLAPPPSALPPVALTVVAALAALEAVEGTGRVRGRLKWPNDAMVGARKIGGVLLEARSHGTGRAVFVAGVGINANQGEEDFPPELRGRATSLRIETGRGADLVELGANLVSAFDGLYLAFREGNARGLEGAFLQGLGVAGERVVVEGAGGEEVRGRVVGLTFREGLALGTRGGVVVAPLEAIAGLRREDEGGVGGSSR